MHTNKFLKRRGRGWSIDDAVTAAISILECWWWRGRVEVVVVVAEGGGAARWCWAGGDLDRRQPPPHLLLPTGARVAAAIGLCPNIDAAAASAPCRHCTAAGGKFAANTKGPNMPPSQLTQHITTKNISALVNYYAAFLKHLHCIQTFEYETIC